MKHELIIKPGIPIEDRQKLEIFLQFLGYNTSGGGQMLDGSESDISFEKKEPDA